MTRDDLLQRISIDPNICFGKACIRGTRIWVALILENLASGTSTDELLEAYPQLRREDNLPAPAASAAGTRGRILPLNIQRAAGRRTRPARTPRTTTPQAR